ncbi:amidohydrolase family protein [Salibacter halophilus]|uniref:Amidohydrolase family protein n=1 Tax=Salibacter halophilus TaxID=1803916 RepID=A0A6N6M2L6_9FLAO|nr:amidohydrolase family protein [Salibacter halophilus]KAB1063221.1 amidohydrolase family protein [Salibacter halophilus]
MIVTTITIGFNRWTEPASTIGLKRWLISILLIFFGFEVYSQIPTPAGKVKKSMLILGGTAHVGDGRIVKNAAIGVKNGHFTFVENQMFQRVDTKEFDTIIRLTDEHIYPGFIAPNTTLGLREVDAVRATRDFDDVGLFNPNVRSLVAYNTDSRIIPTIRSNGVLLAQATPRGGLISGSSSIMQLDGWNWEDAVLKSDDGIHLNWPERFVQHGWWANPGGSDRNKKEEKQIVKIEKFFTEASAYYEGGSEKENLRFEAMKGVFDGSKRLYIHCNQARAIVLAMELKRDFDIPNVVLVGGYDAYLVPEALTDNDVPVIYQRPHSLPHRDDDPIHLPYQIPKKLQDAGILYCLDMSGSMEAMNQRNLPFVAGTAHAYGLDKEQAIAAISGNAAKILGIDETVGTLDAGKQATFFISKGDALDMRTNKVRHAFIQGAEIDLDNPQKALYRKFKSKYEN